VDKEKPKYMKILLYNKGGLLHLEPDMIRLG